MLLTIQKHRIKHKLSFNKSAHLWNLKKCQKKITFTVKYEITTNKMKKKAHFRNWWFHLWCIQQYLPFVISEFFCHLMNLVLMTYLSLSLFKYSHFFSEFRTCRIIVFWNLLLDNRIFNLTYCQLPFSYHRTAFLSIK